jgi:hypothetical protein
MSTHWTHFRPGWEIFCSRFSVQGAPLLTHGADLAELALSKGGAPRLKSPCSSLRSGEHETNT